MMDNDLRERISLALGWVFVEHGYTEEQIPRDVIAALTSAAVSAVLATLRDALDVPDGLQGGEE